MRMSGLFRKKPKKKSSHPGLTKYKAPKSLKKIKRKMAKASRAVNRK